ncbi:hypothetical protein WJX64_02525 [Leifsonia sp. YIM 134122]|uniref:Uncharacterized protein n=1 Tax=Leifsonia stereocauli TaxID=3134136 RepID=A0ABU9W085_9MICO
MTELGERALQREIDDNRRSERRLIPQALLALLIVAGIVFVRQVYFL